MVLLGWRLLLPLSIDRNHLRDRTLLRERGEKLISLVHSGKDGNSTFFESRSNMVRPPKAGIATCATNIWPDVYSRFAFISGLVVDAAWW